MKKIMLIILFATLSLFSGCGGGGNDSDRLFRVEQELLQQREATGDWQTAAAVLAVGAVVLLVIGTAVGSKVRRYYAKRS